MTIELTPDIEARLKDEAQRRGVDLNECAKQVLDSGPHGLSPADFVVATGNVGDVSRFVPAEEWSKI